MKNLIFAILLFLPTLVWGQSDRKLDAQGNLIYQYNRTVTENPQNSSEKIVTFVFVNGNSQRAISYRQETLNGIVSWTSTSNGKLTNETIVDCVTTNLKPGESVTWKYTYSPRKGSATTALDKAAILIMDDTYATEKIVF